MLPTLANTYSEKECRSGVYNTEMELTFKQTAECVYTKRLFYVRFPVPRSLKKIDGGKERPCFTKSLKWCCYFSVEERWKNIVHVHLLHKNLIRQKGKCMLGYFAEAGMPSTGCWCISEEYKSSKMKKKRLNWFHLEPVLSNMSNRSISKDCALFLLCGMKKRQHVWRHED